MQKQKFGRIIMTSSPAGLYGNFGQANYSAAKAALIGFMNTLSIEGKKFNIHVNTIAPIAETRMTADIIPGAGLLPEHIAPFVVYMCHDSCVDSGIILEAAGGFACKTRLQRSQGLQLRKYIADKPTVECVQENWATLSDFTFSYNPKSVQEASDKIMASIGDLPAEPLPASASSLEKAKSYRFPNVSVIYDQNDVIKYALSIGASLPDDSLFLYEGHKDFSVIPTFAAILSQVFVDKNLENFLFFFQYFYRYLTQLASFRFFHTLTSHFYFS